MNHDPELDVSNEDMEDQVNAPSSTVGSALFPMAGPIYGKKNPLTDAIQKNDISLLEKLIKSGSDINAYSDLSYDSGSLTMQETPVVTSARTGSLAATRMLVEQGCDLNGRAGCEHPTPLQISANKGHYDVVKYLIEAGADVNYPGYLGFTPIIEATMENHLPIVRLLAENDAVINCRTSYSYETTVISYDTLLMISVVFDQDGIAEYLVKAGADVNVLSNSNSIPLAIALSEKKEHLSNLLVAAGSKLREKHLHAPYIKQNICLEHIKKLRLCPLTLAELSRIAIRENFISLSGGKSILGDITATGLPPFLKKYVAFEV